MKSTVIIPTTGSNELRNAIESVLNQTQQSICYVVCDGDKFKDKVSTIVSDYPGSDNLKVSYLPINVGANGFYGHRIYASYTHLINTPYVFWLDQDNWYDGNHVESCIDFIEKNDLQWCHSLRKIYTKDGQYVCNDDCESLGKYKTYHGINHVDTNTYCLKTEVAVKISQVWHGGWGQDRVFLSAVAQYFPKFDCTGKYTTNYRVDGGQGSVTAEFFYNGNKVMNERYNGVYPWTKI